MKSSRDNIKKIYIIFVICGICLILNLFCVVFSVLFLSQSSKRMDNIANVINEKNAEKEKKQVKKDPKSQSDLSYTTKRINSIEFVYPSQGTIGVKGFLDEYECEYYMEIENVDIIFEDKYSGESGVMYYLEFTGITYYDNLPDITYTAYDNNGQEAHGNIRFNCQCGEYIDHKKVSIPINKLSVSKVVIDIKP